MKSTKCLLHKMMWCALVSALLTKAGAQNETLPAPLEFSSYEQVFYDRIHLTWQAPNVTTDFFGYKIDYFPEAQPKPAIHITFHLNVTNVIIHNLRGHTDYVFRLYAIRENKTGTEGIPAILNVMTIDARPFSPTLVEVSPLDTGGVAIKWLAPTIPFDGEIKQYEITLRPEGEGESHIVRTNSPTLLEKTVGGLKQKTTYFVSVKAVSSAGPGLMSEEWVVKTKEAEDDDTSLIIIMCCAIIIPVFLMVLFVLLYIFVLRPAFMSPRQESEEIAHDHCKTDTKLTELTNMNGSSTNPLVVNSEKPPLKE
ncbi:uncharacterized protein LOC134198225 isoform X2 [Corticium candelabrum]|nr:uncharacterized protein LOC134198225 isoform X2 [Corticium candelabrum]